MKTCTIVANVNESVPDKDYEGMAIRLAKSIRLNGGKAKDMPMCFWYPDDYKLPKDETLKKLESYGCKLNHGTSEMMRISPMYGKIYATMQRTETDYTMLIDTDCYIRKDISGLYEDLDKDLRLCPVSLSTSRWSCPEDDKRMNDYYAYFGLKRNVTNTPAMIDKKSTRFYFTSGLIVFRSAIEFGKKYKEVIEGTETVDGPGELYNANSQTAIGIVATKFNLSWELVDTHYMYMLNHHKYKIDDSDPAIVHYQDHRVPGVSDEDWNV